MAPERIFSHISLIDKLIGLKSKPIYFLIFLLSKFLVKDAAFADTLSIAGEPRVINAASAAPRQASDIIHGLARVAGGFMPKLCAISAVRLL